MYVYIYIYIQIRIYIYTSFFFILLFGFSCTQARILIRNNLEFILLQRESTADGCLFFLCECMSQLSALFICVYHVCVCTLYVYISPFSLLCLLYV